MYTTAERELLLGIARESIRYGLKHGKALPITLEDYNTTLRQTRASFVTLKLHRELRGCIGTLTASRPLAKDVAHNAFAAAFRDPRFSNLTGGEFPLLEYHLSILSPPHSFLVNDEADLLEKLQPGIDGLVLAEGKHHSTFLPSVWESLPAPIQFVRHLKIKAGLGADHWSDTIRFQRYSVEDIK